MADRLGLNEARAIVDAMLGALGESGGSYQQDEEIGQLGAKLFAGL